MDLCIMCPPPHIYQKYLPTHQTIVKQQTGPTCGFTFIYGDTQVDKLALRVVVMDSDTTHAVCHSNTPTVCTAHCDGLPWNNNDRGILSANWNRGQWLAFSALIPHFTLRQSGGTSDYTGISSPYLMYRSNQLVPQYSWQDTYSHFCNQDG